MKKIITILILSLTLGYPSLSHAQISDMLTDSLQDIIEQEVLLNEYKGLSAAVIFPDGSIWQGAAGEASPGVAVDTSMNFIIGSITKNFLATLVLRLEEEGFFSIEDSIGSYLPTFPYVNESITIKELLNHTSGLSDLEQNPAYIEAIFIDLEYQWTPEELLINFQEAPLGPPGTIFQYSNSNYIVLAALVQATTGNPLETEFRSKIFEPLGMVDSWSGGFETSTNPLGGAWTDLNGDGNLEDVSSWPLTSYLSSDIGAGNIISRPSEVVHYAQMLYEGFFLTGASMAKMLTPTPGSENPPFEVGYGLGTSMLDFSGYPFVGHDGQRLHQSIMLYNPLEHFGIVICVNHETDIFLSFLNMAAFISEQLVMVPTKDIINQSPLAVKTFPNPFSSEVWFDINNQNSEKIYLEIFDQLGRKIKTIESNEGANTSLVWDGTQNSGATANRGFYFYRLTLGQQSKSGVIEKF